jgi:valyl-tRNA synthetase
MNRRIPVITDEYVDIEFGTGALKITPAHDPNDFEIGQKYNLDLVKVIGEDGAMTGEAGSYAGLDRFEARKRIVEDLEREGLLVKVEPYRHSVGHCYRCKTVVEPNLSSQWFVNVKPLAEKAIEAVKEGKTRIIPSNWEKTYFEWMNNIKDWCISRQIWWGHRIPAWYCKDCGKITVDREDPASCTHCGSTGLEQDSDVLDTWFSSALWPFSTLGWPDRTEELESFYPTSCLVTGFDILFFWVARMMMMGLKFMGDVPFKDVYIHALVRDLKGQKMSKSRGNVIDPLEVIDNFGTDSFRFTLTAMAAQGRDVRLSEDRIEGYRHFVNKIWNASRFALMNLDEYQDGFPNRAELDMKDRWIVSRLNRIIQEVSQSIDEYKFNETAHCLYQFIWHEFCDWYLEMAKAQLYQKEDKKRRSSTQQVMVRVLKTVVELLHPVMPFVTEEIWQKLPHTGESIVIAPFPEANPKEIDSGAEADMDTVVQVVTAVRNIRSEMNVPPSARPKLDLLCQDEKAWGNLNKHSDIICGLAGLENVSIHKEFARPKSAATAVIDKVEIFLCLEGIINFDEERKRLQKEMEKVLKDRDFLSKKLSNDDFLSRAPEEIVNKERDKERTLKGKEAKLRDNIKRISKLCA